MAQDIIANKGIVLAGQGQLNATTLSVGDHARATSTLAPPPRADSLQLAHLRHEVSELNKLLEQLGFEDLHPAVPPAAQALKHELEKSVPEKSTVLSLLKKLADGTTSVTTIAQSVAAVAALAATVFS
jgi:hypothetical protein